MIGKSLIGPRMVGTLRRGGVRLLALGWLAVVIGCGGNSIVTAPPPSGGFSNASLKGSYAFSLTGNNNFGFYSIAGNLQADGNGNITGGSEDINSASNVYANVPITGSYSITPDGRGLATVNSSVNPINIAFVLLSNQRALIVRFDTFATASGTMDLQDTTAFSTASLQGGLAFSLFGVDNFGSPFGSAGNVLADASGNFSNGIADFNDAGTINTSVPLSGSWTVGPANGRGTASLATSLGTLNFAFYVVDANHLKLVETDSNATLGGEAFRQAGTFSNASVTGAFPFTLAGGSTNGAFVAGGIFNADGSGKVSGGVEDVNNGGVVAPNLALSGSYAVAASGRGTMSLTNPTGTSTFVIYPSSGGVLMLETDAIIIASGFALVQSGASFSNTSVQGNDGLNLSGSQAGFEIDTAAQFNADGNGHLSGSQDINNGGALYQGLSLSGTYSVNSNGRGLMALHNSTGTLNLEFYIVNPSRVLFIEMDATLPAVGEFDSQ